MKTKIILIALIFVALISCEREAQFSEIPAIKFVSLTKIPNGNVDNKAILKFSFQDGDGDIGLDDTPKDLMPPFDTTSVYYYNFYLEYYEKQNGVFTKIDLDLEQNGRIPRLSNVYPESIEGEIDMQILINNPLSNYDTVKFDFYIYDRDLNMSNIESTPEIIIKKR